MALHLWCSKLEEMHLKNWTARSRNPNLVNIMLRSCWELFHVGTVSLCFYRQKKKKASTRERKENLIKWSNVTTQLKRMPLTFTSHTIRSRNLSYSLMIMIGKAHNKVSRGTGLWFLLKVITVKFCFVFGSLSSSTSWVPFSSITADRRQRSLQNGATHSKQTTSSVDLVITTIWKIMQMQGALAAADIFYGVADKAG